MNKHENIVNDILNNYSILGEYKCEFFIEETNVFYKVYADKTYMLKIFQEESSKLEDNLVEALFLKCLKDKGIKSQEVIENDEGELVTITNGKRAMLYSFIEGDVFDSKETNELFFELGKKTAELHEAMKDVILPKGMNPKRWDKVFYYRDEEVLYHLDKYSEYYSKEDIEFLDKAIEYVDSELIKLYDNCLLIHGDINPWNVLVDDKEITFIDFEEGLLGNEMHDIAIILFYYKYDDNFNYEEVKKNILKGYRSVRKLDYDERITNLLIAARTLNYINYILVVNDEPADYITSRIKRVKELLIDIRQ